MNPDFSHEPPDELEARITALLLGELTGAEAASLRQAIETDPDLAELHDRLKQTIGLVREVSAHPAEPAASQSAPMKLSAERREKLLAQFKTVKPKEFQQPVSYSQKRRARLAEIAATLAVTGLLAAAVLPLLFRARHKAKSETIFANLRQLDGAKQSWALETRAPASAAPTYKDIEPYMGRGPGGFPESVAGEKYIIGKVGESPTVEMDPSSAKKIFSITNGVPRHFGTWGFSAAPAASERVLIDADGNPVPASQRGETLARLTEERSKLPGIKAQERPVEPKEAAQLAGKPISAPQGQQTKIYLPGQATQSAGEGAMESEVIQLKNADAGTVAEQLNQYAGNPPAAGIGRGGGGGRFGRQLDVPVIQSTNYLSQFYASAGSAVGITVTSEVSQVTDHARFADVAQNKPAPDAQTRRGYSVLGPKEAGVENKSADNFSTTYKLDDLPSPPAIALSGGTHGLDGEYNLTKSQPPANWSIGAGTRGFYDDSANLGSNQAIGFNGNLGDARINGPVVFSGTQPSLAGRPAIINPEGTFSANPPAAVPQPNSGHFLGAGGLNNDVALADGSVQQYGIAGAKSPDTSTDLEFFSGGGLKPTPLPSAVPAPTEFAIKQGYVALRAPTTNSTTDLGTTPESVWSNAVGTIHLVGSVNFSGIRRPVQTNILSAGTGGFMDLATATSSRDYPNSTLPGDATISIDPESKSIVVMSDDATFAHVTNIVRELDRDQKSSNSSTLRERLSRIVQRASTVDLPTPSNSVGQLAYAPQPSHTVISSAESTVRQADNLAYRKKLEELEGLKKQRDALAQRSYAENVDVLMPRSTMVSIIEHAEVETAPPQGLLGRLGNALAGTVERKARVKVEHDVNDVVGVGDARAASGAYDPHFIQTEFEVVQSEPVLDKVIEKLNLNHAWADKSSGQDLKTSETRELLKRRLDLKPSKNNSLLDIGVKDKDPQEAAKIANAIAQVYTDNRAEKRRELTLASIQQFQADLAQQDDVIKKKEAEVHALRPTLAIANGRSRLLGPGVPLDPVNVQHYNGLKVDSVAELPKEMEVLNRLKGLSTDELRKTLPTAAPDNVLAVLLNDLLSVNGTLAELQKTRGENDSQVKRVRQLKEQLNSQIDVRMRGILDGMQAKVDALKDAAENRNTAIAAMENPDAPTKKISAPLPEPQPEVLTSTNAFSTFSLNVADVSFKLAAASLEKGVMPEPASIRSEEFINAFDYRDPEAAPGVPVAFAWERARYPFAQNRDLLRFSLKTAASGRAAGLPLNIVLLLDNSGSMERADRVQIVREALRVLAAQLQPHDVLSIVTFARTPQLVADGVPGNEASNAVEKVSGLTPQGGTNLEDAMRVAYETAVRHYFANGGGVNRVVLLTDGAANLGSVDPTALKQKVESERKQGIALDCFGIGWEDYNDDLLEVLARNGDGRYGFLNTPAEASTGFAHQLAGALNVAASDVKVQVEFNPARVTVYRQIGYAKLQLTKEQFRDNTVDAAEIAAQEAGNALYTLEVNPNGTGPLATVRIRYKIPGIGEFHEHEWSVPYTGNATAMEQSSPAMRLSATASAFSEWLANNPYATEVTPDALLRQISGVPEIYGADQRPKKLEWMLRQAKSISGK